MVASNILAIDPGNVQSAYVQLVDGVPAWFGKTENEKLIQLVRHWNCDVLAIEYMRARGMPTANEELDTQFWAGRFVEAWGKDWTPIYRRDVKLHICEDTRAKDPNVRQALIDRFGGQKTAIGAVRCPKCKGKGWCGVGRPVCPECGGEKWQHPPGPLYGIAADVWSALAIAVTYFDTRGGDDWKST